jgi:hypothetical protein
MFILGFLTGASVVVLALIVVNTVLEWSNRFE